MKNIELVSQYKRVHLVRKNDKYAVIIQQRNSMQIQSAVPNPDGTKAFANGFSDSAVNYVACWQSRSAAYRIYRTQKCAADVPTWARL